MEKSGRHWVSNLLSLYKTNAPGHCYLMSDNLPEAYTAYQQALYHLQDLKVRLAH
jgi:hypothetical protein